MNTAITSYNENTKVGNTVLKRDMEKEIGKVRRKKPYFFGKKKQCTTIWSRDFFLLTPKK